jgi:hypothetical protein
MVSRYRKKPVEIEAIQWTGDNYEDVCSFVGLELEEEYSGSLQILIIETLEGTMRADKGDFIIKGIKGEFYPCKPDIFQATYDIVK